MTTGLYAECLLSAPYEYSFSVVFLPECFAHETVFESRQKVIIVVDESEKEVSRPWMEALIAFPDNL